MIKLPVDWIMIGKLESCYNVKVGQKGVLLIFQAERKLFLGVKKK